MQGLVVMTGAASTATGVWIDKNLPKGFRKHHAS
jgi:hypothetical protein